MNCFKDSSKMLWSAILLISIYSLLLVGSVSREGFNYFTVQFISILIGLIGAIFLQFLDYKSLAKQWKWIGAVCVLLMLYTLFFGVVVEGSSGVNARAWIKFPGNITFQPSELVKIGFIITFAKHLFELKRYKELNKLQSICWLAVHALIPVALTHFQGDDGAAVIFLCIAITMAFMAGIKFRYFLSLGALCALVAPLAWKFILADYQRNRILSQLNPEADPLSSGYQQIQGKLSIGSGGIFGYGLFKGPRVANNVVPIQESDFIFSVSGEELGFIGCILILILLLVLIIRIGFIAKTSSNTIGALMCFGFIGLIASQAIFNLGMCLSLFPVMGVTLPFFSVGGSSAACLYLAIGIIQNIYISRDQTKKLPEHMS